MLASLPVEYNTLKCFQKYTKVSSQQGLRPQVNFKQGHSFFDTFVALSVAQNGSTLINDAQNKILKIELTQSQPTNCMYLPYKITE